MKICFFTENYYKGGLDTFLINLFNTWPDPKDKLVLICNGSHPGLKFIIRKTNRPLEINKYYRIFTSAFANGISTFKWRPLSFIFILIKFLFKFIQYPILLPWYVFTLMFFFRRTNFDRLMVVNGGYPASLLCRTAVIGWRLAGKRPLAIMNFHNSTKSPPWYFSFFEGSIDKMVIRSSSHIISVSKKCLGSLYSRNAFSNCKKLSYIYNGIEDPMRLLEDISIKVKNNLPTNRYCLMLATYEARKGHKYILQAFQKVIKDFPDVHLRIYGYGRPKEKKYVESEIVKLNLQKNVLLGDFIEDTTLLIARASVLVVPSQAYESFGLSIIEAMALGVPLVTTDVGGIPEVLKNSNAGYVCSKNNSLEFAHAIKKILSNSILASTLGQNGRIAFENRFIATKMTQQYFHLIKLGEE